MHQRLFLTISTVALLPPIASGNVLYTVTDLPKPGGTVVVQPSSINSAGQIVGTAYIGNNKYLPLEWTGGAVSILPGPINPDVSVIPQQINDAGSIVGTLAPYSGAPLQAVIWSNDGLQYLPTDSTADSTAMAINNSETIVGESGIDSTPRATLWSASSPDKPNLHATANTAAPDFATLSPWQSTDLGVSAGDRSTAVAINDNGAIAGNILRAAGPSTAFILQGGITTDLGSLGGGYSSVYAMNQLGDVVGVSLLPSGYSHAFIWSNGVMADLEPLPGQDLSLALGINDAGEVVGDSSSESSSTEPVIWIDQIPYDLNDLIAPDSGWVLQRAVSINDAGDIVGTGYYNDQQAAFLLTPTGAVSIPEPTTILLASGFCLLASFRRRRNSQ